MLKYTLVENFLTDRPDDYMAQTVATRTYTRDDIIDRMLQRGTLVTRTDIVAVLNNLEETVEEIADEGSTVNMPLFNTSFSISGVFEGPMDTFDPNRHKLNINVTKGTRLRNAEKRQNPKKIDAVTPMPNIMEVRDFVSDTVNDLLTPGGVLQLWGSNIKLAGDHPDVGLWFIPETGEAVRAAIIVTNKPSSIIAMVPAALSAGNHTLRVVTQYSGGSTELKTPRVNTFNKTLVVP